MLKISEFSKLSHLTIKAVFNGADVKEILQEKIEGHL